ncbi:unnamed protein product [Didymodactylos carnosus]|uniref:ferroxidase n=1 Tax=Didymodactylos carnosus TaxID=1234261 RepID=A0A813U5P2_9BILA|nr:unnamed protein product [Didymodactylos carnosus]CAF0945059.1 unnamed protein product [Didymodactylos carnosus]CAF3604994.1 unnamed protein product [Didymodactylos carnosus]CAF3719739.1 unnamed protein product [Didymodactylos carnosus]
MLLKFLRLIKSTHHAQFISPLILYKYFSATVLVKHSKFYDNNAIKHKNLLCIIPLANSSTSSVNNSSSTSIINDEDLSLNKYETIVNETLESLTEKFEYIIDKYKLSTDYDVTYSNGVLTVDLGQNGTYVVNKQTPNRQIWLSSPRSGPRRYDYIQNQWLYKHDHITLHELLTNEISEIFHDKIDFHDCSYGKKK